MSARFATRSSPDLPAADLAADLATQIPGSRAVFLFGSGARGTAVEGRSDVDLLLLVEDRRVAPRARELTERLGRTDLSLLVHDERSLAALRRDDWSFVSHLDREALPLHGETRSLASSFRVRTPRASEIRQEIAGHLSVTDQLSHPHLLGASHMVAYARLFAALKSAAILDGIETSEVSFDRGEAISALARRRPEIAHDCRTLAALEPFWLRLRRRPGTVLPWRPRGDEEALARHVAAAIRVFGTLACPR